MFIKHTEIAPARITGLLKAAEAAARAIPPAFPLEATVAVNPFLGQSGEDLAMASARLARVAGVRLTRPRAEFAAKVTSGTITDENLADALIACTSPVKPVDLAALKGRLHAPSPDIPALPTLADLAAQATGLDWPAVAHRTIGLWAAGHFDAGQALWADWLTETATYNGQVYTGFIPEPTAVKTLVAELIEQAGLAVWWDEVGEAMRLQVLRAIATDAQRFDETNVYRGSLKITAQPDKRKSEIWSYFDQVNPVKGISLDNLKGVTVLIDTNSEANYGSPLLKVIASRWIPTGGRLIADRLNQIQLGRYLAPPRAIEFQLVVSEDTDLPVVGGGYRVSAPMIQGGDGARVDLPFSVTGIKVKDGLATIYGEELNWTELRADPFNRILTIDYNSYNVNWRTLHDNAYGTPQAGGTVTLQIASNARIGSTSASVPALDTGTWPSVAFTGTRTIGSPTLTSIASTAAFVVGQAVTGLGIPDDSRVVSKTVSTVTLDKNATIAGAVSLMLPPKAIG